MFGGAAAIPAVLYRPSPQSVEVMGKFAAAARPERTKLPLLVYFHGGGWVVGSAYSHDPVARSFCALGEVVVLNVDYRLAPEHAFPAAAEDAVAAFRWAVVHADELGIDPHRIAVGGDSAGGNLSAVVAQEMARLAVGSPGAEVVQPALQMLFVPVTDLTMPRSDSYETFSENYFLTRDTMDWYEAYYLGGSRTLPDDIDELRADPRVSPLRTAHLPELADAGLAPAYVAVAGFDPLRDEDIAYARRLSQLGVHTSLRIHTDAVHPFINMLALDMGRRAMSEAIGAMRVALGV